ncbi:MAG: hypothetical protein IJW70_00030 [Clostridia bacterium]|nr:hypothetical protein [Clostridia bacterium]
MKHTLQRMLLLMLAFCIVLPLAACTPPDAQDTDTQGTTQAPENTDSESLPESETTPPEQGEIDYYPGMTYVKEEKEISVEGFDTAKLGQAVDGTEQGVASLLSANFDDGDKTAGGKIAYRDANHAAIIDGQMYFIHDGEKFGNGWSTWSPVVPASVKENHQIQLSLDIKSFAPNAAETGNHTWISTFIGCYVSNYSGKIPDAPGDGLWFSFSENDVITVIGGTSGGWPTGFTSVKIPRGFADMQHVDIVCTENYDTNIYGILDGGERQLLLKTSMNDTTLSVFDGAGELVAETANNMGHYAGDYFVFFTHMGGSVIDNVNVYACQKEEKRVETVITAVPDVGVTPGLDMTDKTDLVSICYSVWFDGILGTGTEPVTDFNNITEVLQGKKDWGPEYAFHYWAKPAQGYYRSTDIEAAKNNLILLGEANVDFIILDYTNANDGYISNTAMGKVWMFDPLDTLCRAIFELRAEGYRTPYIVCWCGTSEGPMIEALYDRYYTENNPYADCFVYWEGKPFMIYTAAVDGFPCPDKFTVRHMWGLTSADCWRFLNTSNKNTTYEKDGVLEQISVAVASQETYMSMGSAHGRNNGKFFYRQWVEAFRVHPKVVTITWWNEWTAQRFIVNGESAFVDNYNQEYSRDIEPMEGGHGDLYYQWMKQYIAAYKGGEDCPKLLEE